MILILDSSKKELTTILVDKNGRIFLGSPWQENHQKHLLPEVEKLLQSANCELDDIKTFACVAGPGSFTGVRLAVATVKGFCLVQKNAKVVAINMLDLLAKKVAKTGIKNFALATKCTSTRVYCHVNTQNKCEQFVCSNEDFVEICNKKNLAMFGFLLSELQGQKLEQVLLEANDYVEFVQQQIKAKNFVLPTALEPIYMALSQAEEELKKKENNAQN